MSTPPMTASTGMYGAPPLGLKEALIALRVEAGVLFRSDCKVGMNSALFLGDAVG